MAAKIEFLTCLKKSRKVLRREWDNRKTRRDRSGKKIKNDGDQDEWSPKIVFTSLIALLHKMWTQLQG